ncbi:MAG TPA: hypothetical protein VFS00_16270, partial [Polyangiaceae bacterium]|nr:hypothetical protein [Polyangiaceae bacterium]
EETERSPRVRADSPAPRAHAAEAGSAKPRASAEGAAHSPQQGEGGSRGQTKEASPRKRRDDGDGPARAETSARSKPQLPPP